MHFSCERNRIMHDGTAPVKTSMKLFVYIEKTPSFSNPAAGTCCWNRLRIHATEARFCNLLPGPAQKPAIESDTEACRWTCYRDVLAGLVAGTCHRDLLSEPAAGTCYRKQLPAHGCY